MENGPVQKVVGARVRQAREDELGITQTELSRQLAPYVQDKWSPAVVSRCEVGSRAFQVNELVALALVLERPVGWLLTPVSGSTLQVGDCSVSRSRLQAIGVTDGRGRPTTSAAMTEFLRSASLDLTNQAKDIVDLTWKAYEASMHLASDANAIAKGPSR